MGSGNTNRLNLQAQQIDKRSKRQRKKSMTVNDNFIKYSKNDRNPSKAVRL